MDTSTGGKVVGSHSTFGGCANPGLRLAHGVGTGKSFIIADLPGTDEKTQCSGSKQISL